MFVQVDKLSGRLTDTYSVSAIMSNEDQITRRKFTQRLKHYANELKNGMITVAEIPPLEISYTITLSDRYVLIYIYISLSYGYV